MLLPDSEMYLLAFSYRYYVHREASNQYFSAKTIFANFLAIFFFFLSSTVPDSTLHLPSFQSWLYCILLLVTPDLVLKSIVIQMMLFNNFFVCLCILFLKILGIHIMFLELHYSLGIFKINDLWEINLVSFKKIFVSPLLLNVVHLDKEF